jgi:hypothetical protein
MTKNHYQCDGCIFKWEDQANNRWRYKLIIDQQITFNSSRNKLMIINK